MGAIEAHAKFVGEAIDEGLSHVSSSISELAQETNAGLSDVAAALNRVADALGAIAKAVTSHEGLS
jgi:methyl-accepting chemotaxis protein